MTVLLWIIGLAGGWVALTLAMNLPRERRLRRLAASRAGSDAFAAFRQALPELPEDVVIAVYRGVQGLVAADFPVKATDGLLHTLEVDQGSLDDLIEELSGLPNGAVVDALALAPPITTVGDLARTIGSIRESGGRHGWSQPAP